MLNAGQAPILLFNQSFEGRVLFELQTLNVEVFMFKTSNGEGY